MKTAKERVGVRGSRFIDRSDVVSLIDEHERDVVEAIAVFLERQYGFAMAPAAIRDGAWRKAGK